MNENYVDIVKELVLKKVPASEYSVFLFGSRAAGNAHQMSDIDVGFLGETDFPIMLKAEIEEAIDESIVPFKVDLVDFKQVGEAFRAEALKHIVIWNFPKSLKLNYLI